MRRLLIAPQAGRDIDETLRLSAARFGAEAAQRYRRLIAEALRDLRRDPGCGGVKAVEGAEGVLIYHLRHARLGLPVPDRVARPRHLLAFRAPEEALHILRLLHDSMDAALHLD